MAKAIKTAIIAAAVTFVTIYTGGQILGALKIGTGAVAFTATQALQYAVITAVGTLVASGVGLLSSKGVNATRGNFGTKLTVRSAQAPRQIIS